MLLSSPPAVNKRAQVLAEGIQLALDSVFAPEMQGVLPPPKCLLCPKGK